MISEIQKREFDNFLEMLNRHNLLSYVIVIGSWAEILYAFGNLINNFTPSTRTLDLDFLVRNMRQPRQKVSLFSLADKEGYSVYSDYITGVSKFITPANLEIEFLINQKGSGEKQWLDTNLGVRAQTLRHFDVLLKNVIEISYEGMSVLAPAPEAYVAQKLIINNDRGGKAEKDLLAILNIWPYIKTDYLLQITKSTSKKEQKFIKETLTILSEESESISSFLKQIS